MYISMGELQLISLFLTIQLLLLGFIGTFTVQGSITDERVAKILNQSPIIDGHNDLPWRIRELADLDLKMFNLSSNLKEDPIWGKDMLSHTDLPRLRKGKVGGLFLSAYTDCNTQYKDSVEKTLEQIDVIKRVVTTYPNDLEWATSADDIERAIKREKIAIIVAVEGGHSIQSSLGILRSMYALGARYLTLTHTCNTPWADASPVDSGALPSLNNGLSNFGMDVVREMNRLGMMVDLSHTSADTMRAAFKVSRAPIIFSHSSARGVCNHHRNVPDDVLELVKKTNSIVMVNFYSGYVRCDGGEATIQTIVDHLEYIRNKAGPDHIGLGSDYNGIESLPTGLEDVSTYPSLIAALLETGRWTEEDLVKLTGKNILRVMRAVEMVRDDLAKEEPKQSRMHLEDFRKKGVDSTCFSD